jgi:hypothetical protein
MISIRFHGGGGVDSGGRRVCVFLVAREKPYQNPIFRTDKMRAACRHGPPFLMPDGISAKQIACHGTPFVPLWRRVSQP